MLRKKSSPNSFMFANVYRTITSRPQGASYCRRYDRELVSKPAFSLKKVGEATVSLVDGHAPIIAFCTPPLIYLKKSQPQPNNDLEEINTQRARLTQTEDENLTWPRGIPRTASSCLYSNRNKNEGYLLLLLVLGIVPRFEKPPVNHNKKEQFCP